MAAWQARHILSSVYKYAAVYVALCCSSCRCLCRACVVTSTPTSTSTSVTVVLSLYVGWPPRSSPTRRTVAGRRSPMSGPLVSSSMRCSPAEDGRWTTAPTSRCWPGSTRPPTGSHDRRRARPMSGRSWRRAWPTSCTDDQRLVTSSISSMSRRHRRCSRPPSGSCMPLLT